MLRTAGFYLIYFLRVINMQLFTRTTLPALFAIGLVNSLNAFEMRDPKGEIVLTVKGAIEQTNSDDKTAEFDMEMLKEFEPVTFTTNTIWTEGEQEFTGVLLKDLYDAVGVLGEEIQAYALDDYIVDLLTDDAAEDGPIIAYLQNGEEMSIRDKGPLWIMYPFDDNPDYQTEIFYATSIWQLVTLDVLEN